MRGPRHLAPGTDLVELGCHRVAVRVHGDGDDPLLLINGTTRPQESWDAFSAELPGRTIISFDAPGVGGSATPVLPPSIVGLAAVARSVLDAADVNRCDVLGYSHGGAVAQQLAFDAPERVRRLILVSTSCGVGAYPGSGRAVLRSLGRPGRDGHHPWPRPGAVGVCWHSLAFTTWSSIPFLGAITAPTLVVSGTYDRVVPPVNGRILAGRIPGAVSAELLAGHDMQGPGPAQALARIVDDFLTPHDAPAPAGTAHHSGHHQPHSPKRASLHA